MRRICPSGNGHNGKDRGNWRLLPFAAPMLRLVRRANGHVVQLVTSLLCFWYPVASGRTLWANPTGRDACSCPFTRAASFLSYASLATSPWMENPPRRSDPPAGAVFLRVSSPPLCAARISDGYQTSTHSLQTQQGRSWELDFRIFLASVPRQR